MPERESFISQIYIYAAAFTFLAYRGNQMDQEMGLGKSLLHSAIYSAFIAYFWSQSILPTMFPPQKQEAENNPAEKSPIERALEDDHEILQDGQAFPVIDIYEAIELYKINNQIPIYGTSLHKIP